MKEACLIRRQITYLPEKAAVFLVNDYKQFMLKEEKRSTTQKEIPSLHPIVAKSTFQSKVAHGAAVVASKAVILYSN